MKTYCHTTRCNYATAPYETKKSVKKLYVKGFMAFVLMAGFPAAAATFVSDGSAADTQAKINSAADGDTVQIPAGTFTWTSGVSISGKGIKLAGSGGGGFQGYSRTSLAIGTGSKVITTQSGLAFQVGQTVRVIYKRGAGNFMEGTVTSYSGTDLTLNVTSVGGSGTFAFWTLAVAANSTIINSAGGGNLITLIDDASHNVELANLKFIQGTSSGQHVRVNQGAGVKPVLIHDCWFSTQGAMLRSIEWAANGGIIYRCSFDESFAENIDEAIVFKPLALTSSWSTPSTMGVNDTTGMNNTYVEDCYFAAISLSSLDFDDNSRSVLRRCIFDNAAFGSHGQDTSPYGLRHFEVYDNTLVFDNMGSDTYNLNWFFYVRGGTGVIVDNTIPNISSSAWGDKPEIRLTVFSIRRGPTQIPCQTSYPASHQIGRGFIDGSGGSVGDLEPLYIWNNTGNPSISLSDYQPDECGNGQTIVNYVQAGRDYISGTPKPGYAKYVYPHPLRAGSTPVQTAPTIASNPQSLALTQGQAAIFSVSVAGSTPLAYQWQKNLANLVGATASSYTIAASQTNDAGSYRCVVTNAYGSATSAAATLTVNVPAPVPASITANPQSITRTIGQSATFSVGASGDAPLSYQWQKNLANVAGATSSSYTIASAQTNDAGNFRCVVVNPYGSATSAVATLTVTAAPTGNLRYVDFTAGNDSNAGTLASPWKRCPGMVGWAGSATLQAGDTVYFDRSDTWDVGANSWGPGLEMKAGVHYVGNQWDPEGVGTGRAILRAAGRQEAGNVRFWEDHLTIPTELEGFDIDGNGYRANGIDINHAFWTTGLADAVKRINNCVVHGQTGNGAEGDYKYGVIASDHSPDASGRVANVEILDTVVYNVPRVGISIYPSDTGSLSNIVVRGCEVYNTSADPSYTTSCHGIGFKGDIRNSVIENCYVHDVTGAAVFISGPESTGTGAPTGLKVRYNVLKTAAVEGVVRFYSWGNKSVDVYGNIILQNESGGGLSFSGNSGTLAAKIYNNTFFNSFVDIGNPSSTGTIEFKNNLIYELDDTPLTDAGQKITSHSDNLFYRSGGGTLVSSGGTSYSAANLTSGYEATALGGDPLFKNVASLPTGFTGTYGSTLAPNADGLSLQTNSPAIGTGADLTALFNGSINSVARPAGSGWDMGAYQRSSAGQPPPVTGLRIIP